VRSRWLGNHHPHQLPPQPYCVVGIGVNGRFNCPLSSGHSWNVVHDRLPLLPSPHQHDLHCESPGPAVIRRSFLHFSPHRMSGFCQAAHGGCVPNSRFSICGGPPWVTASRGLSSCLPLCGGPRVNQLTLGGGLHARSWMGLVPSPSLSHSWLLPFLVSLLPPAPHLPCCGRTGHFTRPLFSTWICLRLSAFLP
jgi:hypothetical protein